MQKDLTEVATLVTDELVRMQDKYTALLRSQQQCVEALKELRNWTSERDANSTKLLAIVRADAALAEAERLGK